MSGYAKRLSLAVVILASTGCDQVRGLLQGEPKTEVAYTVHFVDGTEELIPGEPKPKPDESLLGAHFIVDGRDVGEIVRFQRDVHVSFDLETKHVLAAGDVALALRFETPCGDVDVSLDYTTSSVLGKALTPDAEERFREMGEDYDLNLDVEDEGTRPEPFVVWVDDEGAPKAEIRFGQVDITSTHLRIEKREGGRKHALWGVSCAAEHAVTVDGTTVGVAKPGEDERDAYLVSTQPGRCYAVDSASYTDLRLPTVGGGTRTRVVEGAQVLSLEARTIDFPFQTLPGSIEGAGGAYKVAFHRTPCGEPTSDSK